GMVCVVGRMRDLILQLSKSSIYSTKPQQNRKFAYKRAGVATDEFHAESFVRGKISVWPGDGKKGRKC
ncbi:hypothetical protein ACQKHA_26035, partial [Escherichia coli]